MTLHDRKQRFEVIYVANYADILAYVRRRIDSHDDAADALAETFTTAWRRLDDIPEGREARLWLFGVARRVLANDRRAESRRVCWNGSAGSSPCGRSRPGPAAYSPACARRSRS
ncbi:RNA polymerase sigma factor [Nonomuraea sp. 10N515B]|uniref:RNA polymerase sigma factor n=1 Tax=Nonomuraea sp. 10N515B TaxID=3457422 RepID=UPI003FCD61CF